MIRVRVGVGMMLVATMGFAPQIANAKTLLKGSYVVKAAPDPVIDGTAAAGGQPECTGVNPLAVTRHPLKVAQRGMLKITMTSEDLVGDNEGAVDWDLYLFDAKKKAVGASHGPTAQEKILIFVTKPQTYVIMTCDITSTADAKVAYLETA